MGKRPICRKGKPFRVVNENTGYSVIKLIFSIRETKVPQITGGETISESEFDQD